MSATLATTHPASVAAGHMPVTGLAAHCPEPSRSDDGCGFTTLDDATAADGARGDPATGLPAVFEQRGGGACVPHETKTVASSSSPFPADQHY